MAPHQSVYILQNIQFYIIEFMQILSIGGDEYKYELE